VSFFRTRRAEADLAREINGIAAEDTLMAQARAPTKRYAARRALGGVEQVKERQRDARTFRWLAGWRMDLKLGARMLVRSPGLTVIAVVALAVAIGGGAAYLEFVNDLFRPTLPIRDGDRVVGILNWDTASGRPEHRSLYDFAIWRERLASVEHLGAFLPLERNLITGDGRAEPVKGVEISASAFRLVPTPPMLGRPLVEEDERAGALPVVVLGHDLWHAPLVAIGIVGQTVRLGAASHGRRRHAGGLRVPNQSHPLGSASLNGSDVGRGQGPAVGSSAAGSGCIARPGAGGVDAIALSGAQTLQARTSISVPNQDLRGSLWSSAPDGLLQRIVLYT
jgi:hypothetical protein